MDGWMDGWDRGEGEGEGEDQDERRLNVHKSIGCPNERKSYPHQPISTVLLILSRGSKPKYIYQAGSVRSYGIITLNAKYGDEENTS